MTDTTVPATIQIFLTLYMIDDCQITKVLAEWEEGTTTIEEHEWCPLRKNLCNCQTWKNGERTSTPLDPDAELTHDDGCGRLGEGDLCTCPTDTITESQMRGFVRWIAGSLEDRTITLIDVHKRHLVIPTASVLYAHVDSAILPPAEPPGPRGPLAEALANITMPKSKLTQYVEDATRALREGTRP